VKKKKGRGKGREALFVGGKKKGELFRKSISVTRKSKKKKEKGADLALTIHGPWEKKGKKKKKETSRKGGRPQPPGEVKRGNILGGKGKESKPSWRKKKINLFLPRTCKKTVKRKAADHQGGRGGEKKPLRYSFPNDVSW